MKNINYLIIVSLLWGACFAQAFKSSKEAATKLQSFQSDSYKNLDVKAKFKLEDDIVDSLIDAVSLALKEPKNLALRNEIIRVGLVFLKNDDTQYAGELLLPLYKKDKSAFKDLLRSLPATDAQLLEASVENAQREDAQGNG